MALGKFDALHVGHRELVIQASRVGTPFLMSFVGMAEVFGWEPRYAAFQVKLSAVSSSRLLTFGHARRVMSSLTLACLFRLELINYPIFPPRKYYRIRRNVVVTSLKPVVIVLIFRWRYSLDL